MRELGVVLGFLGVGGVLAAGVAGMARFGGLEEVWLAMIAIGSAAVLCEIVYFALLFAVLRRGQIPERWYARSFEHHHRLSGAQKAMVLPFFYIGMIGLLLALLLAGVLFFAGMQMLAT